jgi:inorganic pyrophosphatase
MGKNQIATTLGELCEKNYRIFLNSDMKYLSFIDDILCWYNKEEHIVNMVVEIPKGTNYKLEISQEKYNPIKYDIINNKIRTTKLNYPYNYGAIPQTWENPNIKNKHTGLYGDDDPLDIFDIGDTVTNSGDIVQIKILGAIAMIDDNCTDWKVIGININDPLVDSVDDVGTRNAVNKIMHFLNNYKNDKVIIEDRVFSKAETYNIVNELHDEWKN